MLATQQAPKYNDERRAQMPNILIVDDDPDFVQVMSTILESHGYQVSSAASGAAALEAMRSRAPDILLLDVMMATVLDGLNVTHAIRSDPQLKNTPIIMISSIGDSPQAGMFPTDEYIPIDVWMSKPIAPEDLLRKVAKLLQAKGGARPSAGS